MSISVSHSYFGTVTIVEHASTNRFVLTLAEAERAIGQLADKIDTSRTDEGVIIEAAEGGQLEFHGPRGAFLVLVKDLTTHTDAARAACAA